MILRNFLWIAAFLGLSSCKRESSAPFPEILKVAGFSAEILSTQDHVVHDVRHPYHLIRISRAGVRDAFVQYLPPPKGGPVVVIADPYSGLDWSRDPVDIKWASRAHASKGYLAADEGSTGYVPGVSKPIAYRLVHPSTQASDVSSVYLFNGIGVMIVHGRFYRGSTIQQLLDDMGSAFRFLAHQTSIDTSRIAVLGNSLGGFMAAHGAARAAEAGLMVKAGSFLSPALDFSDFLSFHFREIPSLGKPEVTQAHADFCDPHLRRIFPLVGSLFPWQGGDYSKYGLGFLKSHLKGKYLVFHDEWDTMTPFSTSAQFVKENATHASPFWYQHPTAPDFRNLRMEHAPNAPHSGLDLGSLNLFSTSFIMNHLLPVDAPKVMLYLKEDVSTFFRRLRSLQVGGREISWIVPRLVELANPKITLINVTKTQDVKTGDVWVSATVNEFWGLSTTPSDVKKHLETRGLR